jgi:LysR family transcriptional regulator, glycine cleavage system transcriptional activator
MRLPPLSALRAFESLSRHGSIKRAADELSVTPAAVSQHIKSLEDWLGVALTEREGRGVKLNATGSELASSVQPALRRIAEAVAQLRTQPNVVRVTSVPSLAAKWLAPRLGHFMAEHPKIDLRLSASDELIILNSDPFDVAIRETLHPPADVQCVPIFDVLMRPYASPEYIRTRRKGRSFNWQGADLLHGDGRHDLWNQWCKQHDVSLKGTRRAASTSHWMLVIEAAKAGRGVALLPHFVVETELERGDLMLADEHTLDTGRKVWLCWPHEDARRITPAMRQFIDWVLAQVRQTSEAG